MRELLGEKAAIICCLVSGVLIGLVDASHIISPKHMLLPLEGEVRRVDQNQDGSNRVENPHPRSNGAYLEVNDLFRSM